METFPAGTIIAGKYRIVRVIGEGGMGTVYEAFHTRLRQRVALKMLRSSLAVHPELVERFEREARAAATIESRHVAKVMDVDQTPEGQPYMVIEFLDGHDLGVEVEQRIRLPIEEAVGWVTDACAAVAHAHSMGIIHRDLKPSNLFLAKKGNDRVLKLLDFGISKALSDSGDAKITSSLHSLGTPHYMSPEQVRRSGNVDSRSDVWSLGVILYEVLTGTVPFPDEPSAAIAAIAADPIVPPRQLREDIPEALEQIVMRALEKDKAKRFQSARDLATALAPFLAEEELVTVSKADALPRASFPDIDTMPPPSHPSATPISIPASPRTPLGLPTPNPVALTPPPAPRRRGLGIAIAIAFVAVIGGAVAVWGLTRHPAASPSANATASPSPPPSVATKADPPVVDVAPAPTPTQAAEPAAKGAVVVTPLATPTIAAPPPRRMRDAGAPATTAAPAGSAPPARTNPVML